VSNSSKIDLKSIKRRILATTLPPDILHRAPLINSAMVPLYNHVLMALPTTEQELQPLDKKILSFLWTRTVDSETVQKRSLVASKRLLATFHKGGLQIQKLTETAEGLRINLIQKSPWAPIPSSHKSWGGSLLKKGGPHWQLTSACSALLNGVSREIRS
jgi:hypothetical protein